MSALDRKKSRAPRRAFRWLFRPVSVLLPAILLADLAILGAVLFGLLESPGIAVAEPSYLRWAWYYLDEISLVLGSNAGLTQLSLPALALATSQVGLLAIWASLGKSPAALRWLTAAAGISLWTCAFSFVFIQAAPWSKSAVLFLTQWLAVVIPLLILRYVGYRLQSTCETDESAPPGSRTGQYTLAGMLLAMTSVALLLGVLPRLSINTWIVVQGLGCALCSVVAMAVVFHGKWWSSTADEFARTSTVFFARATSPLVSFPVYF
jgi:hypothetical protein